MRFRMSPVLGVVGLSVLALHVLAVTGAGGLQRWATIGGWTIAATAALVGTLAASLRVEDVRMRLAWRLWALGSALWLAGTLVRAVLVAKGDFSAPSLAEVPLVLSPIAAAAGVAFRLPRNSGQFARFVLDATPVVVLAAGVVWIAYAAELGDSADQVAALAYAGSYGLLAAVGLQLVLAYARGSRPRNVSALAAGFALAGLAAVLWPAEALPSGVAFGHLTDGLWSVALLGFAVSGARRALAPHAYEPILVPLDEGGRRGLPAIASVPATIVLFMLAPLHHGVMLVPFLLVAVTALVARFYIVREELGRSLRELRASAEEARDSAARFRAIFEAAPVGCALTNLSGRLVETNSAFQEMLGLSAEELHGKSITELTHPDDADTDVGHFADLVAGRLERYEIDKRYVRSDGTVILGHLAATVLHDDAGAPQFCLGLVEDVTVRTEGEQRVREAEEKYRTLVENLPLVTYIDAPNPGSTAIYISPQVVDLLGYGVDEWLGDPDFFEKVLHPEDRESAIAEHTDWLQVGGVCTSEYRLVSLDERTVWVRDQCVLVRSDSGDPLYVQGYLADITDLKTLELERTRLEDELRQAQKMEAVGRLSGGIAHDFNNLLTAIGGYADVLRDHLEHDERARDYAVEIQRASDRAAELTQQLLAFGRRQVLRPTALELGALVGDVEPMLRRLIGEDVEIVCSSAPARVLADPGQLEQVVMNLALNARDAMPDGGTLTISTGTAEDAPSEDGTAGRHAVIEVTDTGCGISEEHQAHIFEPFFTTKPLGKGTGLGLSTVYGIVNQSNGRIEVESTPDVGTTFRIYLPVTTREVAELRSRSPLAPIAAQQQGTILLVEDEASVRGFLREVLTDSGYSVLQAADADEAYALFQTQNGALDLILTDVVMPGESGPELVRRIAKQRTDIKVIYMSGYSEAAVRREGRLDDDAFLLEKPFTIAELTRVVRGALSDLPSSAPAAAGAA